MKYIILDLELNSKIFKSKLPNEIIEIGAVMLNEDLEKVDTFQSFVKPKVHKKLFPVIKQKTKISQQDINDADCFKKVLERFHQWIGDDYILCSWGHDDIHHLKSNCQFNRRGTDWLKKNIDIQRGVSKLYDLPQGQRLSLKNALAAMNIPLEDTLHRADIDAEYTAQIFIKAFDQLNLKAPGKKA